MPKLKQKSKKKLLLIAAGLLCIVVIIGLYHYFHTRNSSDHLVNSQGASGNSYTKGANSPNALPQTQSLTQQTSNGNTVQPGDNKSENSGGQMTVLLTPTGNFVSNHGQPDDPSVTQDYQESSSCTTTPGATCQIVFTMSGAQPVSLPAQTTDRGGATYWNDWTPAQIGLTTGSWQLEAIATLNGQTKTATDATPLVVSQ